MTHLVSSSEKLQLCFGERSVGEIMLNLPLNPHLVKVFLIVWLQL
ncbi:hypothetical protein Q669_01280 [Labrenzia sp. C1B10]|nr:hypothetical protein Q669_01280 [Labrenzia sp. C1B10]ERS00808.1 hypothetical protein Q675_08365 [Labrenzia sp. C1B70]